MVEATRRENEEINNRRAEEGHKEMKKYWINEEGNEGKERIRKMKEGT
jgi:hypothetical protein